MPRSWSVYGKYVWVIAPGVAIWRLFFVACGRHKTVHYMTGRLIGAKSHNGHFKGGKFLTFCVFEALYGYKK